MSDHVTKSELSQALNEQTTEISQVIAEFAGQVNSRFDDLSSRFGNTAAQDSLQGLQRTIDKFVKRLDDNELEGAAYQSQFNKLLDWARKVSEKTVVPLENL